MRGLAATALAVAALPRGAAEELRLPPAVYSFRATVQSPDGAQRLSWQLPERFAQRPGPGQIERRLPAARPDAFSALDQLMSFVEFVMAEARAGKLRLPSTMIGGRRASRARVRLYANKCAGLPAGSAEVFVDLRWPLPLRTVERRGKLRRVSTFAYRRLNARLPPSDFRPPRLGPRPLRRDAGFVRTSPREAARRLSYRPLLPTKLPYGFFLAASGWAPRSSRIGPEGSIPPHRELFGAVYRRGFERIDVTQRLAGRGGWPTARTPALHGHRPVSEARARRDRALAAAGYALGRVARTARRASSSYGLSR